MTRGTSEDKRGGEAALRALRAAAMVALALSLGLWGCGGKGTKASAPENGIDYARRGNYKVRATENGRDLGIGLYDDGSLRLLPEGRLLVLIYDRESNKGWSFDRGSRRTRPAGREEVAAFDNFMPATLLEPYFQLKDHWSGGEFRMTVDDGRAFRIIMDGPRGLPTLFEVVDGRGAIIRRVEWSYFKVGEVSRRNFQPPSTE